MQPLEPSIYPPAPEFNYADFGTRFLAALIDGLLLAVVSNVISFSLGFGAMSGMNFRDPDLISSPAFWSGYFAIIGVTVVLQILYFAYFESSERQATPGKMAMKLRVTDMHGERLSFANALGRSAFKNLVSGTICLIGYIVALFTEKKQALHDLVANTLVIKD